MQATTPNNTEADLSVDIIPYTIAHATVKKIQKVRSSTITYHIYQYESQVIDYETESKMLDLSDIVVNKVLFVQVKT